MKAFVKTTKTDSNLSFYYKTWLVNSLKYKDILLPKIWILRKIPLLLFFI